MMQLIPDFTGTGPSATPGLCYFCRSIRKPDHAGVISTGISIDMEGLVELCLSCIEEMGSLFGMATAENASALRTNNRRLGRQVEILETKVAGVGEIRRVMEEVLSL